MSIIHEHVNGMCITRCLRCRFQTILAATCQPNHPLAHRCHDDSGRIVMRYRRDGRYEYAVVLAL